jgi:hypothetical protein
LTVRQSNVATIGLASAGIHRVKLVDSPARRWVPLLLLATYAACDFLAQALLPAVAAAARAGWLSLPDDVLEFVKVVVGKHQPGMSIVLLHNLIGQDWQLLPAQF